MKNRHRTARLVKQRQNERFLSALGKEMLEQDNCIQASPRYWGIMDYKWTENTTNPERLSVYDPEEAEQYEIDEYIQHILNNLTEDEREEHADAIESMEANVEFEEYEDALATYERTWGKEDIDTYYESLDGFIATNAVFFTKEEAAQHLKHNRHHYHEKAHTYAMTAWRAPKMEKLVEILEEKGRYAHV